MNPMVIANTQIRRDPVGRYCLNDLHQASGSESRHKPANWLRMDKTAELIDELAGDADSTSHIREVPPALETVNGGPARGTYAVKELVYAYAMWISPKFHLHVIRAYDATQQASASERPTPDAAFGPMHRADVLVGAARGFGALVRAARQMGMGRPQAVKAANRATERATGVDLVTELGADELMEAPAASLAYRNGIDTVGLFHHAWQAGELPVPYRPCMSRDAFYLYQHWCRVNKHAPDHLPRFVHRLRVEQGVRVERRRYTHHGTVIGPVGMLLWGEGGHTSAELGQSVIAVQQAVKDVIQAAA